jgi:Secretion system C-terminal sorting domain
LKNLNELFMKYLLLVILSLSIQSTYSQLYIGSDGMTVKSSEVLHFDGLTLTPSADLTLTSTTLTKTDDYTISPPPVGTYIKRYFSFSTTTPTFAGTIRFSYSGATLGSLTAGNLRLNIRTGSAWTGGFGTDVGTGGGSYVEATSLSSSGLNTLTLADASGPLPVTWLSFTAEKQGAGALLKWSTATEQNTKDFEVQHSTNTLSWTPLGTVAASGNSTITRQYSFTHNTPFKGGVYNYYRILQRDLDGKFSYSKIASLIYDEPGADVIVYPNPAKEAVTIYLAESKEVKLVNVTGATVWRGTLAAGRNQIPLSHLSKGVYWVVTENYKKQLLIQ